MEISNMKMKKVFVIGLLGSMMAACGDSDLVDIHEQELDDAYAAEQAFTAGVPVEPDLGPAQPASEELPPTSIDVSDYELVFSDEFGGDSLDDEKWSTSLFSPDTVIYDQLQYYVDTQNTEQTLASPFSFDGQYLTINATMTPEESRAAANEQGYLSGILSSKNAFNFTFGYVEARINVQEGRGIWPSLWMLGSDTDGQAPEVYVFEYDGSKGDSIFHNYNYVDASGNLRSPGQQEVQATGFSEGFHTIGLRWSANELLYYVDGQPSYRIIGENVPNEDMYLILNLAMGGVWSGAPDATTPDPATLDVDYIRVYQLRDQ